MTTLVSEQDRPDFQSAVVKAQEPALILCRDVAGGWAKIKARSTTYLPKHPKEQDKNYQIRLNRPTFFNAFSRTLEGLVGMVFRTSPGLATDVPKPIETHWENIDKEGNHGEVFLKTVFSDAMEAGHNAILVDFPKVADPAKVTLADERALDLRPYWVHVRKEDIMNLRTSRGPGGERVLEQVTIRFTTHEAKGLFGDEEVVRYRVYRRVNGSVTWETWQAGEDKVPRPTGETGTIAKLTQIPLVPIYGRQTGYFQSVPPLLDLANLNLLHYQTNSDFFHALHIGMVPTLVISGGPEGSVEAGPNTYLALPQGATAAYLETAGTAFGAARQALEDLKGEMAVLGLSLLQGDKRAAETAEAKRMDKSEKDSALTTAARALEDGVEQCLMFHAQLAGLPTGGSITVNTDFAAESLTPEEVNTLSNAVAKGQLSIETMWQKLKEGEWLPDDFDPEVEMDRLRAAGWLPEAASQPSGGNGRRPTTDEDAELVMDGNPYRIVQHGDQFCVEKKTGERVKCHPTKEAAMAHFRALEANVSDA